MLGTVTVAGDEMKRPGKQNPCLCEAGASERRQERVRCQECYQNGNMEETEVAGGRCSRYLAWEDLPAEVTLSWDLNEVLQP